MTSESELKEMGFADRGTGRAVSASWLLQRILS